MKQYEHHINQLLNEQAIELNKIVDNVTTIVNYLQTPENCANLNPSGRIPLTLPHLAFKFRLIISKIACNIIPFVVPICHTLTVTMLLFTQLPHPLL